MGTPRIRMAGAVLAAQILLVGGALSQERHRPVDPQSPSGLRYYAQGGVVVDGVAYFTSDDGAFVDADRTDAFPCVVAFDVRTFRKLKTYPFAKTYDSSPLLFQKRDGTWLVIAHEHKNQRTVAIQRDTGKVEWISDANQPGAYFFGYSYFTCADNSKLILMACQNGLHAVSGETGKDVWWVRQRSTGGITPCVDQDKGWIFYQCNGKVLKVRADDGAVLKSVAVGKPNRCISWNTVLVDDEHGYFVVTRWYGAPEWDSALRVYDENLKPLWQKTALPHGKKATITYAGGKLVVGSGNGWNAKYTGDKWKYVAAYSVSSGEVLWRCDLKTFQYGTILNAPYFNGCFYAETQDAKETTSKLFRINAANGKLEEVLDFGRPITSCAPCIIAQGRVLSGDLHEDGIVATEIAESSTADWPGPFGDPQTNQCAVPHQPGTKPIPMKELTDEHLLRDAN